jgi:hypothetical protein
LFVLERHCSKANTRPGGHRTYLLRPPLLCYALLQLAPKKHDLDGFARGFSGTLLDCL